MVVFRSPDHPIFQLCYNFLQHVLQARGGETVKRAIQSSRSQERPRGSRWLEIMAVAEQEGLLRGERTQIVRGRMPEALVKRAKTRTGITSDTELIEVALANIAVQDDYADWLLSRRGAVSAETSLEF